MAEGSLSCPFPGFGGRVGARRRGIANRLPRGENRARLLWQAFWAPFWLGSDVPTPLPPARESARPADVGLAGEVVVGGLDQIARRLWLRHALHILVRAAWLGLAVGCVWLLVELRGGPVLDGERLIWIMAVLGTLGAVFAALSRPGRRQTARMLDRTFGLHERMTTAVDHLGRGVPKPGERASVVYLQMADAANVVADLRRHRTLGFRLPVRELVLAIFWGLVLAALYFLRGVGGDIPPVTAGAVPPFTPAVERPLEAEQVAAEDAPVTLPPTVEEVLQRSERSNEAQRDLQALARALDDHAVTRSAAEAIGRGDYESAGDDLRELAPNADQLSPAAREELARDLDEASAEMSPGSSDLSEAARGAAGGLREGEEAAQEGVRELGDAVEQTGDEVVSQQELAEQMRQAEAAEAQGRRGQGERSGPANAGEPGQDAVPGEAADGQSGEPSDAQGGQPGQGDARAGGERQPGDGQAGPGQEGGEPGSESGQPGEGQQGGEPGRAGQPGEGGESNTGEGPQSERGGGAGSGDSQEDGGEGRPGAAADGGDQGAQGAPAEQRVTEGSGEQAETGEPNPVMETIELPPGTGGESVQTSNDAGSSSQGSGAGVTAGSGSAVQGEVGEAGPDSNRVPPAYRSLVERYFSEPAEEDD